MGGEHMNDELRRMIDRVLSDTKIQPHLHMVKKPTPIDPCAAPVDSGSTYAQLMIALAFFALGLSFIMPTRADQVMFAGFSIVLMGMGIFRMEPPQYT